MVWLYLLSAALALSSAQGACHKLEQEYYEEIGCRPEVTDERGCVTSYDCSSLGQRSQEQCHYQGRTFERGHKLERTAATACLVECRCGSNLQQDNTKPVFSCISIECPELFNGPPKPGCYRTYSHDKCCHLKEICVDETSKKASKAVCEYDGQALQEGQKFYPKEEPCKTCICQQGFNGSFVEPYCHKVHCNLELMNGDEISRGCVPVYYGQNGCCPIDWKCPEETDTVVPSSSNTAADPSTKVKGKTCEFGKLTMQVGDKLGGQGEDVECLCKVPPHPICIQHD